MSWLLPLSLVLLVGIVMGAGHILFVRWMQRASAPDPIADSPSDERGDEASPQIIATSALARRGDAPPIEL